LLVPTPTENADLFRKAAESLGFAGVAFTPVLPFERHVLYERWLADGFAGEMRYLNEQRQIRAEPRLLLDDARTIVTVALSNNHPNPPDVPGDRLGPRGRIARYARGTDYHIVLKSKLLELGRRVAAELGRAIAWRALVDTGPLHEREAAERAGLGFTAKNTLTILPGVGSYVLLGELVTDLECQPGQPAEPKCGQCRACLDACPTGAFVDAYTLDARRCISYLTIELAGTIPVELRPLIGDHVLGCDRCQEVCPFNAGQLPAGAPELLPRAGNGRPGLRRLLAIGSAQFRKWQRRSAMRRVHRPQLQRNAAVALGNVGGPDDLDALAQALDSTYPLVRAHAAWAIGEIARRHTEVMGRGRELLEANLAREASDEVRSEIERVLYATANG
jgi:epoxyqueuosine reductase